MKCSKCGTKISVFNQSGNLCKTCIENTPGWREATAALEAKRLEDEACERLAKQEAERERRKRATRLILTTETAHNLPVTDRLGIVTAEVVFGVDVFKDLFADARGIVGGRSQTIQKVLRDAREECLREQRERIKQKTLETRRLHHSQRAA